MQLQKMNLGKKEQNEKSAVLASQYSEYTALFWATEGLEHLLRPKPLI